ncbi:Methionyl-tRNA formyltransferase [Alphaproteobacteria bacterium]
MKIVFMGTPEFAVPILSGLIESGGQGHQVIAVYTKPPHTMIHHGNGAQKSPVHILAEDHNVPVFTPHTFKVPENVEQFKALNSDICVVAAYGLILRKVILAAPKYGCINVHPSALPRWRGAAPVQRTLMAGDQTTAVCIMQMDEGLDTGPVILRQDVNIDDKINADKLSMQLASIGARLVIQTVELIKNNCVTYTKQSNDEVTYANKVTSQEEVIDWNLSAHAIACQIKALARTPGAYFKYGDVSVKILEANYKIPEELETCFNDGTIDVNKETYLNSCGGQVLNGSLAIKCGGGGILFPMILQKAGRRAMDTSSFLRGCKIEQMAILS